MLIAYGKNVLAFTIHGSQSPEAAFLNDSSAMADGRTGTSCSMSFTGGVQGTGVQAEIRIGATSTLDTTIPWGFVCINNVQGLPAGTKLTFNGVTQRLTYNRRGELGACWLPTGVTGSSKSIFIYNDVNGVASLTPGQTFAVGEIFVGRAMYLREASASPVDGVIDTTVSNVTAGGQVYPLMRKPRRTMNVKLGPFTTAQAFGGSASDLLSGAVSSGTIDIQSLREILATTNLYAVCATPNAGRGAGTVSNGFRIDTDFMQKNWMLARPLSIGDITHDMDPYWTWALSSQEAT